MEIDKLKDAVNSIKMDDETKKNIIEKCKAEISENKYENRKNIQLRILTVAAIIVLSSVTVFAVGGYIFHNPKIVKHIDEISISDNNEMSAYSVSSPISKTPHSLSEVIASARFKSNGWTSKDTIGGCIKFMPPWTSMKMIENEKDPKIREIYNSEHAVKTEYIAENPKDLKNVMSKYICINPSLLNENYNYVPDGNTYYTIYDKHKKYIGEYFSSLYEMGNDKSWFFIGYEYDAENKENNLSNNSYVVKDSYDNAYTYKNKDGFEFLITSYGDCVWAECNTNHAYVSLYGGYITTENVENILDSLDLYIYEN